MRLCGDLVHSSAPPWKLGRIEELPRSHRPQKIRRTRSIRRTAPQNRSVLRTPHRRIRPKGEQTRRFREKVWVLGALRRRQKTCAGLPPAGQRGPANYTHGGVSRGSCDWSLVKGRTRDRFTGSSWKTSFWSKRPSVRRTHFPSIRSMAGISFISVKSF